MAATKQKTEPERDHVVIAIRKRGLTQSITVYGPFNKAHAYRFASHHSQFERDECCVEEMEEVCDHNNWIFQGI
ncbi:MAG: hypothetical protein EBR82_63540 [Caulobacteraceae bacterium]|nr:hypothetical protein [Caulobacteraceae bacterium]